MFHGEKIDKNTKVLYKKLFIKVSSNNKEVTYDHDGIKHTADVTTLYNNRDITRICLLPSDIGTRSMKPGNVSSFTIEGKKFVICNQTYKDVAEKFVWMTESDIELIGGHSDIHTDL